VYVPWDLLARCAGAPTFDNDVDDYNDCYSKGGSVILTNENVTLPWDSAITDLTGAGQYALPTNNLLWSDGLA